MQIVEESITQFAQQPRASRLAVGQVHAFDPLRAPPLGAHVVTPRRGYTHHGIYVGRGRVVHYRGFSRGLRRGPIEEVSLSQFSRGNPIWICTADTPGASPEEVIRRARLRVGESRYRILTNNCEHFCEWCIRGVPRSYQVDALIAGSRGVRQALGLLLSHVRALTSLRAPAQKRSWSWRLHSTVGRAGRCRLLPRINRFARLVRCNAFFAPAGE